jgi:D-sedoheptulose 7-phosphate isomerase
MAHASLVSLFSKYPDLEACRGSLDAAYELCVNSYRNNGKLMICGNGGSAADAMHIVGELMKGFLRRRPVPDTFRRELLNQDPDNGAYLADHLQGALPAISLTDNPALSTAFANDVASDMVFAQQVYGLGSAGDVLLAISTMGNSANVLNAVRVARVMGIHTIGLTGRHGGLLAKNCTAAVCVPRDTVADIQELHLPVYHWLCAALENAFWET